MYFSKTPLLGAMTCLEEKEEEKKTNKKTAEICGV